MIRLAELQAHAIRGSTPGSGLPLKSVRDVPEDSYFRPPTLIEFVRYGRQQGVR
jgi:hypothetical protein